MPHHVKTRILCLKENSKVGGRLRAMLLYTQGHIKMQKMGIQPFIFWTCSSVNSEISLTHSYHCIHQPQLRTVKNLEGKGM